MQTSGEAAELLRSLGQSVIDKNWTTIDADPPALSVEPDPHQRYREPDEHRSLRISITGRAVTLRIATHGWTVHPPEGKNHLRCWDLLSIGAEAANLAGVSTMLARREAAAMRHGIGPLGVLADAVTADETMLLYREPRSPGLESQIDRLLRTRIFGDPRHGLYHSEMDFSLVTTQGGDRDGMPVAVPRPTLISTRGGPDTAWVKRLVIEQRIDVLRIGLVGVRVPETVMNGASGIRFGSLCDVSDTLDEEISQSLAERTISSIAPADDSSHYLDDGTAISLQPSVRLIVRYGRVERSIRTGLRQVRELLVR